MRRALLVGLAAAGPLLVALLRLVLPYYTATDTTAAAADVAADTGAQSLVLWLGLGATLTLAPGLFVLWTRLPASTLRDAGFALGVVGYLCLPGILVTDHVLWVGADQGLSSEATAVMADGLHVTTWVQVGLFVPTHILGIVLVGVLALRRRLVPTMVAWALILSQPLHLTAVLLGLPILDLVAWSATAAGSAWLAAAVTSGTGSTRPKGPGSPRDPGTARPRRRPAPGRRRAANLLGVHGIR